MSKEHVIGRRFVPKGSLDGAWNLILNACKRCNGAKSELEDDISAIAMYPSALGRQDGLNRHLLNEEAARKGKTISRRTGRSVRDSVERVQVSAMFGAMKLDTEFVGAPGVDDERVGQLARPQVVGFMYFLTYDERARQGHFVEGVFRHLTPTLRSDWGNELQRGFMRHVRDWEDRLVACTARGCFKVAIRRLVGVHCWSWALEWNENLRVIGFMGSERVVQEQIVSLPTLRFSEWVPQPDGSRVRHRREVELKAEDDLMFVGNCESLEDAGPTT